MVRCSVTLCGRRSTSVTFGGRRSRLKSLVALECGSGWLVQDFNRLRLPPNVTLVLRQPHSVTLQRTLPCTSHPEPRSNATRMLQSPATKCHTGAAPATQRHTATYMQRTCTSHPEPRSNATRMLQSTAPATKCHTGAAPATQRHNSTYHSLHQPHRSTLQLEVSRVQASQFHVYKRANFTCTSEPAPRVK